MARVVSKQSEIVFVKLGGSLITDKRRPQAARLELIGRLAGEVCQASASLKTPCLIGHGSGSFGHVAADRYGLQRGVGDRQQLPGVTATQGEAARLHQIVRSALTEAEVAVYSLAPSNFVIARAGVPETLWPEPLLQALQLGLLPLVYGDVVMDREWGASICSTEALFKSLVPALGSRGLFVRRIVWLGETDGILDERGRTIATVSPSEVPELLRSMAAAAGTDVTGGMRHRLEAAADLARQGIASWIGDGRTPGTLLQALTGSISGGTRILPGR